MSHELIDRLYELRAYHANAVLNLTSDVRHYRKRADLHAAHVVTIDALLALRGEL